MKSHHGTETVDQFTRGEDAPQDYSEFKKYVREMVAEYRLAGMAVYRSSRCCKDWKS